MSDLYQGTLLTGLVADWRFEGNGNDSSVNAKHLTVTGSPSYTSPGGKLGQAINIDPAQTQYCAVADDVYWELPNRVGKMTLACWVNTKTSGTKPIAMKGTSANAADFALFTSSTSFVWRIGNGTSNAMVTHSAAWTANTWRFVVCTFDSAGGTSAIRLNHGLYSAGGGQVMQGFQNASSVGTTGTTSAFEIGRIPYSTGTRYDGQIARVSLWDRVLASSEVSELYNSGIGYTAPAGGPVRNLKVGGVTVTDLKVGGVNAQTARLGSTVVWSRT